MEQRTAQDVSPYRVFPRAEWAMRREDTPMTLTSGEVARLRSMHDRLDMSEVEEIYLPLSRLLSIYVDAMQRLYYSQRQFLGIRDGHAGAVLAASIFHFGEYSVRQAKDYMAQAGLPVRLDP